MSQVVERHDAGPAGLVDEPLEQAAVQRAHQLGLGLGQLGERAVGERHGRGVALVDPGRVEAELVEHRDGGIDAGPAGGRRPVCQTAPLVAGRQRGRLAVHAGLGRHRQQHPGQHREHRRLEPERRGVGGQRVELLGTPDRAAGVEVRLEQTDLAHALEVGPHRVGVQPQRLGDVRGGQRARGAGQLEVDGVAGVVAERLEQIEPALR